MARTDTLGNFCTDIADSIREKTGETGLIPASEFDTKIKDIQGGSADILLQDKNISITENGTTTITADSGYDGLNNVEVTTNVAGSGGGETPEVGFIINEYDSDGYATKVTVLGMTSLPTYAFAQYNTTYVTMLNKNLKEVILPNNMTTVGRNAFQKCTNLEKVKLPNNLTTLGAVSFSGCTKLDFTELPSGLTEIPNNGFDGCSSLSLTKLPDGLKTVGELAFQSCPKLALTELPSGLTDIKNYGFRNCSSLVIKTIPDGVKTIGQYTFNKCTSLTQLSMNNVTSINGFAASSSAFNGCTALKAIWLGSAITTLERYSFSNCSALTKIFIDLPRATVEAMANYNYAFMDNTSKTGIIVCNNDVGFMTKSEFDSTDWSTYTE